MWELWQQSSFKWQVLVTQGKKGSHKPRRSRKVNFAKQNLHRGILSCSACGICFRKLKKRIGRSSFLYSRGRSHPLSLAPMGHPRSPKMGYLLIAQYLCYINFGAPVSELYPLPFFFCLFFPFIFCTSTTTSIPIKYYYKYTKYTSYYT